MSGETCPHYLIFNETKIKEVDAFVKVAPPLRGADDNGALWSAVADGDVDVVASDHAPFTADEKRVPYHAAPQGIPSEEMMVPVVMDAAARDVLPIERAVQSVTESPARLFGIYPRKGTITAGADADVLLWDPGMVFQVGVESFVSRAGGSGVAYHGLELRGRLRRTILRGATVYRDGQVDTTPRGRYIRPVRED